MPPKKAKLVNPSKTVSKDGAPTNTDGPANGISTQNLSNDTPLPTIEAAPSTILPVDISPPVIKVHKNLTVDIDSIPTLIPFLNDPLKLNWFAPSEDNSILPQNIPHYSDEKPPVDEGELRHHDVAVKKYPYRQELIEHHLDGTRRIHQEDFNVTPSEESVTFEEPSLPTEKFHAERASVDHASSTEHHDSEVEKDDERTQELLENTSQTSIYPTDIKPDSTLDYDLLSAVDDERVGNDVREVSGIISDRKDVKVFFEQFIFNSDTYPKSYPLLQTNIAKRKKRFTMAEMPPWQMVPPELVETNTSSYPSKHHGKTGSSPAALPPTDAKSSRKGKSPILILEPGRDSPIEKEPHEKPAKDEKKSKKQGSHLTPAETVPSPSLKPGDLPAVKNGLKTLEGPQGQAGGGSRFDLKAGVSTMNTPPAMGEPVKPPENLQPPTVENTVKEQSSWEAFFRDSEKLIDEGFDPNETGTGYDTVHGPVGLRKQFLEDERTSGFFKNLLDELVTDWLHPFSSLDAFLSRDGRDDEGFRPSLQDALSVIRKKKKDLGDWSQHAFRGAADAYMERLEGLQKVVYPQYDRGPQQCTIPIPDLAYDKFDGVTATLRREFTYSTSDPFMKTYESQLYPMQDPERKTFTVNREILRYYAPVTSAKDIDYDPRNLPSGGSYLPDHYLTPSQVKTCSSTITDMMAKKEADLTKQMKLQCVRRQEPTPRPKPAHSTIQFPKPKKPPLPRSYYNAKETPHSVFVVRRLNPKYWPERMLPSIRSDAVRPRYLQSTETWSVYVATQKKLLRQVQERARKREELRRGFYLERSCYCRQGRPDYEPKFTPKKRKVTKQQVKLRWSKLALNQSFTGMHCTRIQPPVLSPPRYQRFGGDLNVPETLTEHGYKNPLWNSLREEKTASEQNARKTAEEKETIAMSGNVADVIQNPTVPSHQVSTAFLVQTAAPVGTATQGKLSAQPGPLVPSSARDHKLQAGKKSNLQLDKREKTVQITEPENPDNAPGAFLVSAVNQEEDGISLVIPDKTAIAKNVGNKHIKSKADEDGRTAADRSEKITPPLPKASPRTQSPERTQIPNNEIRPLSHLLPPTNSLLLPSATADYTTTGHRDLTKYTFADIPPDFRYSLLKAPNGIDQLCGYNLEDSKKSPVLNQSKEQTAPSVQPAQPPLLEVVSSSIFSVQNKDAILVSDKWDTEERKHVVEKLAKKNKKAAEARAAQAYVPPLLPRYMMGKQYKSPTEKVKTPRPVSDKNESDPQRVIRSRERNRKRSEERSPISPLDVLFEVAASRNGSDLTSSTMQDEKRDVSPTTPPVSGDDYREAQDKLADHYKTFEGRTLPESIKSGRAHPRQQRSLIYFDRPKVDTKFSNRRKSNKTAMKRTDDPTRRERFSEPGGLLGAGDTLRTSLDEYDVIAQPSSQSVREMGPMEKSTVKTIPRKATERKITKKPVKDTQVNSDGELIKKSSWIKMSPSLNVKNYAVMRHNAEKYKHRKPEVRRPKNLFVLHDNFWKQKAPFVVALHSKPSRKMIPHLLQYLTQTKANDTDKPQFPNILKDFKLVDSVHGAVTLTLKTQADAEMEFKTPEKVERMPDFISKVLRHQRLQQLKHFLPTTEKISLEFSDEELVTGARMKRSIKWYEYLSLSNANFVKQTRPRASLYSHLDQRQAQLHVERLIRRYTGEYHHTHLLRSILKSRSSPSSSSEPNVPDASPDAILTTEVPLDEPLELSEDSPRRTASQKGKSPNGAKSGKGKNNRAVDAESESVLTEESDVTTGKNKNKRESGQNVRGAGPVLKDKEKAEKAKARGASATVTHKPINDHPKLATGLTDGRTTETGDDSLKAETDRASASNDSQNGKVGQEDWPPWWLFDVSDGFPDRHSRTEEKRSRKAELFGSQLSLMERQFNPAVEKLKLNHEQHLTYQERSLLDLVRLLKEKFQHDEEEVQGSTNADNKKKQSRPATVHQNADLVSSLPDNIQRIVKQFQDIASGRLPNEYSDKQDDAEKAKDAEKSLDEKFSLVGDELGLFGPSSEMGDLVEGEEAVRTSCEFRIDPEDFSWQLPQITEIRKKVALRCKYYDACINYLHGLMPLDENEALSRKLKLLNLLTDTTGEKMSNLPRKVQMRNMALLIDDLAFTTCSSDAETIETRIACLVLQLKLAKLHVADLADEAIGEAQRRHNHDVAMKWYVKIRGYTRSTASPWCQPMHSVRLIRTPPSSPPRCPSPSKLTLETGADLSNEDESKDKKGKGDKNADKNKKGKEVKANKSDDKKLRVGSENAKVGAKKNSASSKHTLAK